MGEGKELPVEVAEQSAQPTFAQWRSVGCGVESLHHLLVAAGVEVSLDDVLREALVRDGYDDNVGWKHHALVETAEHFGISGQTRRQIDPDEFSDGLWLVSVNAPEQFESSHLVAVRRIDDGAQQVRVFWPQGQLEHGERFTVPREWLTARMRGHGMRFTADVVPPTHAR